MVYCIEEDYQEDVSLVTNFMRSDRHTYQKAIELSGHSELYIADDATDIFGNKLPHLLALRTNSDRELTDFWNVYRQITEEPTNDETENT